jgi:FKBP-type peptidyl-prolyl cis-trans isomerase
MQNGRMIKNAILATVTLCVIELGVIFFLKSSEQEPAAHTTTLSNKRALSEQFGYTFWKDIKQYRAWYNLEDVIKGMRSCEANEKPPLDNSTAEVRRLTDDLQREMYEATIDKNLKRAEEFLKQIAKKPTVTTVQEGQLYYEVMQEGSGEQCVKPSSTYLFHYLIKTLDEEIVINTYNEGEARQVSLNRVIPGFSRGVIGMKKSEQRRLYIHPDQAYRQANWMVPPQTLLIIDVELVSLSSSE